MTQTQWTYEALFRARVFNTRSLYGAQTLLRGVTVKQHIGLDLCTLETVAEPLFLRRRT